MKERVIVFIGFCEIDFKLEVYVDNLLVRRFDTITGLRNFIKSLLNYNETVDWGIEWSEKYDKDFVKRFEYEVKKCQKKSY